MQWRDCPLAEQCSESLNPKRCTVLRVGHFHQVLNEHAFTSTWIYWDLDLKDSASRVRCSFPDAVYGKLSTR